MARHTAKSHKIRKVEILVIQTTIFSITSAICWIVKALLLPFMAIRWVALYNSRIIKSASRVKATGMTTPVLMLSA